MTINNSTLDELNDLIQLGETKAQELTKTGDTHLAHNYEENVKYLKYLKYRLELHNKIMQELSED